MNTQEKYIASYEYISTIQMITEHNKYDEFNLIYANSHIINNTNERSKRIVRNDLINS